MNGMRLRSRAIIVLAPVVQTLDSAIHRINHYLVDKYAENQLSFYPLDRDLSSGKLYPLFELRVVSTAGIAASIENTSCTKRTECTGGYNECTKCTGL